MNLSDFQSLLEPDGQRCLEEAVALNPQEKDFLQHFEALSRKYPRDLARAALETAILREKASSKFPFAERMYFTREALEQASAWEVSTYRCERFQPFERVVDLGCSIGGDTLALSEVTSVIGIDIDTLRLAMASANVQAIYPQKSITFFQADIAKRLPVSPHPNLGLFFDPSRRTEGERIHSVHDYHPPLGIINTWLAEYPAIGVKISPGVNLDELRGFEAEVEFVSLRGELKEAVLWFGSLMTTYRRATVLPGGHTLHEDFAYSEEEDRERLPLDEPHKYLYEPDPSVLRSKLVSKLGEILGAAQLDPDIAYLTADRFVETPFARGWQVEDWFPFGLKRLRAVLRERGVGKVVVKKRGSPIQPEDLIRDLRLKGDQERVIFLTHLRGKPIVVICLPRLLPEGS
ncbi:MAG: THUMP-like domain-containing protein [Anaerolineales bacterium]